MRPETRRRLKITNVINKIASLLTAGQDFFNIHELALLERGINESMMSEIRDKISDDERIMLQDDKIVIRPDLTFAAIARWSGDNTPPEVNSPIAHLCTVLSDIVANRINIYGEALMKQSDLEAFSNHWATFVESVETNNKFIVVESNPRAIRVRLKSVDSRLVAILACITENEPVTLTQLNALCPEWRTYGDANERQTALEVLASEYGVKTHTPAGKRRTATTLYLTDTAIPVEKREQESNEKVSKADMIELAQMLVTLDARRVELTTELNSVNAQMDAVVDRINNLRK